MAADSNDSCFHINFSARVFSKTTLAPSSRIVKHGVVFGVYKTREAISEGVEASGVVN